MVLDVLLRQGVPVAYTRAHISARVLTKRDRVGRALGVSETVAALEIDHVTCTAEGAPVDELRPTSSFRGASTCTCCAGSRTCRRCLR